jgi:hypothetical protein
MTAERAPVPDDQYLLGVFPPDRVDAAQRALRVAGVEETAIHVGQQADVVAAKRAEMQAETSQSWLTPPAGALYPTDAAKGFGFAVVVGALIGGALFSLFGLIEFGGFPLWTRMLIMAGGGIVAGGAIGAVVGPALAASRPGERSAGDRGVVIRVDFADPQIERVMADQHPIRLDRLRVHDGSLDSTVTTERDRSDRTVLDDMAERAVGEDADFRDDDQGTEPREDHP